MHQKKKRVQTCLWYPLFFQLSIVALLPQNLVVHIYNPHGFSGYKDSVHTVFVGPGILGWIFKCLHVSHELWMFPEGATHYTF